MQSGIALCLVKPAAQLSGKFETGDRTAKSRRSSGSLKRAINSITKRVAKIGCS